MKSEVLKRSIVVRGHKTSVSLEDGFWFALKEIADERGASLGELAAEIDEQRTASNLSSAIRLYILEHFRRRNRRPKD